MADNLSAAQRSALMQRIRSKNTRPELVVRKGLFSRGVRYRLHCRVGNVRPDLVLSRIKTAIFVHGCFWHGHHCALFRWPKTRPEFWEAKIWSNRARDQAALDMLRLQGWSAAIVWECSLRNRPEQEVEKVLSQLFHWLKSVPRPAFISIPQSVKPTRLTSDQNQ